MQATARLGLARVVATAIVLDDEDEPPVLLAQPDVDLGRLRVLGRILQRLEAAEIGRRFNVRSVATSAVGAQAHGDGRTPRLRLEGGDQPLVGEQRRIDATRQVPYRAEGLVGVCVQLPNKVR